jgi:hypothetical protein
MGRFILIDEATKQVIETGFSTSYHAERRAAEIVSKAPQSLLVCDVEVRVSSVTKIEADTDRYPDNVFGEVNEPQVAAA